MGTNLLDRKTAEREIDAQWWGYSSEHGWVVLDRRVATNVPGLKADLLFLRCDEATTFYVPRERWNPPAYRVAASHLRELSPPESDEAAAQLEALKARWPEFEREIQRVCQEEEARVEAIRVSEEKAKKQAAAEKRKQAAASKA